MPLASRSWNAVGIWMKQGFYRRAGSIRTPYTNSKNKRHLHSFTTPLYISFPFSLHKKEWYLPHLLVAFSVPASNISKPHHKSPPENSCVLRGYCGCSYFINAASLIRISAIGVGATRLGDVLCSWHVFCSHRRWMCEAWNEKVGHDFTR